MKAALWFVGLCIFGVIVWLIARVRRQWREREEAAEARLASFIAQAAPSALTVAAAAPVPTAPQERLLLDAAAKAAQADEPFLSIELYAKLLSRYPQTQFASQARAALEVQKKKLDQG